jgi:hypothetical protein
MENINDVESISLPIRSRKKYLQDRIPFLDLSTVLTAAERETAEDSCIRSGNDSDLLAKRVQRAKMTMSGYGA